MAHTQEHSSLIEFAALLAVLAWAAAPWLPYGPLWVFAGAVGFRALIHRPGLAALGALAAGFSQLAWVMDAWILNGGDRAWLLMGGLGLWQATGPLFAVGLATWVHRRNESVFVFALSWGAAQAFVDLTAPLPALHATLVAPAPVLLWPAALGGPSAVTMSVAALAAWLWDRPARGALGCVGYLAVGGLLSSLPEVGKPLVATVIQLDLHAQDARPSRGPAQEQQIIEGVREAAQQGAELVVLPEGAWPGTLRAPSTLLNTFDPKTAVIVGATIGGAPTNSMLAIADGRTAQINKAVLVPLWERSLWGWGRDRYRPGDGKAVLEVPGSGLKVGVLICVEDLVLRRVQRASASELLLIATNDSWNGPGAGSTLHLSLSRLAAVSTGLWVLRPALNGPSAILDPWGYAHWQAPWVDHGPGRMGTTRVRTGHSLRPGRWALLWHALVPLLLAVRIRRR